MQPSELPWVSWLCPPRCLPPYRWSDAVASPGLFPLMATCRWRREMVTCQDADPDEQDRPFPKDSTSLLPSFWPELGHMPSFERNFGERLEKLEWLWNWVGSTSHEEQGRTCFLKKSGIILVRRKYKGINGWGNNNHSFGRKKKTDPLPCSM